MTQYNRLNSQRGFSNFLRPLMTDGLPLMKSVFTPLAKSVLLPFGLSVGMSTADAAIQKKIYRSGRPSDLALRTTTALIILHEEMEDIMKIVKSLEKSRLLLKRISTFLSMLLQTLTASLLGGTSTRKGVIKAGERPIRSGKNF